jgi:hypothetical protein
MDLEAWHDFHVITGGSAAALVGLLFVVISVGPALGTRKPESVRAFISPTVAFFATVLVIAAIMAMPALSLNARGCAIAAVGFAGMLFLGVARIYPQWRDAHLGFEDLLCYMVCPLLAYLALFCAGILILDDRDEALKVVGAAVIALIALGLRNAWDLVIFTARRTAEEQGKPASEQEAHR